MRLADSGRVLHQMLCDPAEEDPRADLVTFLAPDASVERRFTRGEVWEATRTVSGALRDVGVTAGDRVVMLVGNQPEFLPTLFGVSGVGAVSVPLNTTVRGDVLRATLSETEPAAVILDEQYAEQVAECLNALPVAARIAVVGDPGCINDPRAVGLEELVAAATPAAPANVAPWDLATILYTSGTTGPSKGVMCSHNMMVAWGEAAGWNIGYTKDDVAFTTLPLFHANALCCTMLASLQARGRVVFAPKFSASSFWRQVVESRATTANLLGAMATILWRRPPDPYEERHRLRLIMMAPYHREFEERFGVPVTELYGLTDCSIPIAVPYGERRPGSCGLPTPGWKCAVVDEHDEPVARGEIGELVLRPDRPYIAMDGYWRRPEATVDAWRNLWFHTGDYVRQDDDGWFYFVDRRKDALRRGGENVSSWEVEQVLLSHPDVLYAAVYGIPDEVMGEEVMAAVILRPSAAVEPAELVDHCIPRLPGFAVPRYVRMLDDFPLTETEKVQKAALRDQGLVAGTWDERARNRIS
jgi:carnitine-CoA ligase